MQIKRLDDTKTPDFRHMEITLEKGETYDCAGSTKRQWVGPGAFEFRVFPDGAREDSHGTGEGKRARLGWVVLSMDTAQRDEQAIAVLK